MKVQWKWSIGINTKTGGATPKVYGFQNHRAKRTLISYLEDFPQFHTSIKEIKWKNGDPVARLKSLCWTCVGQSVTPTTQLTNLTKIFHVRGVEDLDYTLRRFWETESEVKYTISDYSTLENIESWCRIQLTTKMVDMRWVFCGKEILSVYLTTMIWQPREWWTWKENCYGMIKLRMSTTGLLKVISTKVMLKFWRKILELKTKNGFFWTLQSSNQIKKQTKARIIFDASAVQDGTSLNKIICQGPKLQKYLANVLLRFQRYPFATVGNIFEMYLQVQIKEEDRSMFRFLLWRFLDRKKSPVIHKFTRVVFGMNAAPFEL